MECLFDWAEIQWAGWFSPPGADSQASPPCAYRYYADTRAYLCVSSAGNQVYYLGPDGALQDAGDFPRWQALAGCRHYP